MGLELKLTSVTRPELSACPARVLQHTADGGDEESARESAMADLRPVQREALFLSTAIACCAA